MNDASPPSAATLACADALCEALARDASFGRVRRLMEVDWSLADVTVEAVGLARLLQREAAKLRGILDAAQPGIAASDVADAIRYTERHDSLAQDALWWLSIVDSGRVVDSGLWTVDSRIDGGQ